MTPSDRFDAAILAFDAYNSNDPNTERIGGEPFPKEIIYARRMTERLESFSPMANESVKLAARCQHIGRWQIPRGSFAMDKRGYLQWRAEEKKHHAKIAGEILADCGYGRETIDAVKALLLKKELPTNPDTQLLEDVVCLVFIEHYLEDFAKKHDTKKVIDIIRKTARKMSHAALRSTHDMALSEPIQSLLQSALNPIPLFKFEDEFMDDDIRCIPMIVRLKLDKVGIKLKLSEWNTLTLAQRTTLAITDVTTSESLSDFHNLVADFVLTNAKSEATLMPVDRNPPWNDLNQLQQSLQEKLNEFGWTISLEQWKDLSELQRFALLKLSRPSHKNKNFPAAMKEFGLAR